ncbi:hypothetical protein SDC9_212058 [bioreactor metagenome]|uniref:Uncharacterized protein n=1 Tax=bioreactor metagenome TaxID=1076179 RepID=A0A645JLP8_9ZZZZ
MFCGLGGNTSKGTGRYFRFKDVAKLKVRIIGLGIGKGYLLTIVLNGLHNGLAKIDMDIAGSPVYFNPHILGGTKILFICRDKRRFDGLNQDIHIYPFFFFQVFQGFDKLRIHFF